MAYVNFAQLATVWARCRVIPHWLSSRRLPSPATAPAGLKSDRLLAALCLRRIVAGQRVDERPVLDQQAVQRVDDLLLLRRHVRRVRQPVELVFHHAPEGRTALQHGQLFGLAGDEGFEEIARGIQKDGDRGRDNADLVEKIWSGVSSLAAVPTNSSSP